MIAALYVQPQGIYCGLTDVDLWDEKRDARLYPGPYPVVAHPPCQAWSMLAGVREAVHGYKRREDGGCFEAALAAVRTHGGVLEHPAFSEAWFVYDLPRPVGRYWSQGMFDAGYVCEVHQVAYGHKARKATWLYYVGKTPPHELRWGSPPAEAWISETWKNGRRISPPRLRGDAASATPIAFRDELIALAKQSALPQS